MKIQILTKIKSFKGYKSFSKKQVREVPTFVYQEDCFWFTYKNTRFGIPINEILRERDKTLKKLK